MLILGLRFDYYYDLNDDVLMKDILSGAYSGVPEGLNIQMLYPISLLISVFYKVNANVPWYSLFLSAMQFLSIYLIVFGSLRLLDLIPERNLLSENQKTIVNIIKIVTALSEIAFFTALMVMHLINVQYTITVAFMAAASSMWLLSARTEGSVKTYIVSNLPSYLLIVVGFCLRSEMMLLMLPFIAASMLYSYGYELKLSEHKGVNFNQLFDKELIVKYISGIAVVSVLMCAAAFANHIVYSQAGWGAFKDLFDARTRLYDYEIVPQYEGNEAFYESVGLSCEEAILFDNYNFGIDEEINNKLMWQVAEYAHQVKADKQPFMSKLMSKLKLYIYQLSHGKNSTGSDYPYNIAAGLLYLLILALLIGSKKYIDIWRIGTLFAGRSLIWMYILMGDRAPERITHSLYLIEIVILLGLLFRTIIEVNTKVVLIMIQTVLLSVIMLLQVVEILPGSIYELSVDQVRRSETNASFIELYEYMSENPDNMYLLDVYSTVAYSEKMFGSEHNLDKSNSELMGGWFYGSPIQKSKLSDRGYDSMEKALPEPGVFLVRDKDIDMTWLSDYYMSKEIDISLSLVTTIAGEFEIYEVLG